MEKNIIGENSESKYPSRVKRTVRVGEIGEKLMTSKTLVLCGRVIGLLGGENGLEMAAGMEESQGFYLQDETGRLFVQSDVLPIVGDIIQVEVVKTDVGYMMKDDLCVLASCEDFNVSLSDSPNYRKIVLDESLHDRLVMRGRIVNSIRQFFLDEEFVEVDTPCLVKYPGMEPYLDVFKTQFQADLVKEQATLQDMYLITSPEYALKKLLSGGMEKIFQIAKTFRNKETFSDKHNPEFTMLEWYRAYASYEEVMDDTELLVKSLWRQYSGEGVLKRGEHEINVLGDWERLRVIDAFRKYSGVEEDVFFDLSALREVVRERGYAVSNETAFDDLFFTLFLNEIEPKLGVEKPVVLYDYPVSMAALSKKCARDVRFAERFEVYIGGVELCNGFTELNDPVEQEQRLLAEREERKQMGKDLYDVDAGFIDALKFGMPPSGGNALGVDRLIMLLLGETDINNTMCIPYRDL